MTIRLSIIVAALIFTASPSAGVAEDGEHSSASDLNWSYLYDGGALPFFWGSAAVGGGAWLFLSPPDTPRLFPESEGGQQSSGDTVPSYQVGVLAALSFGLVALPNRPERFFHLKGFAEAVVTTAAITELAKNIVGRHRPSYTPGTEEADQRKSFFSGHASITWASTTYLGLYLQRNVFAQWRDSSSELAWWEPAPLAALAALSFYIPYTRVGDNRHHLTDVLTGGVVGVSSAIGFYIYQERRFRHEQRSLAGESSPWIGESSSSSLMLSATPTGFTLSGSF